MAFVVMDRSIIDQCLGGFLDATMLHSNSLMIADLNQLHTSAVEDKIQMDCFSMNFISLRQLCKV